MSQHERGFRLYCACADCDGAGEIEGGVRGPNDPHTRMFVCPECDGSGEVQAKPLDDEDLISNQGVTP